MESLEDIEDSVSDAFFVFAQHPDKFDPERASLLTFLCSIAQNKLRDKHRARQRQNTLSLDTLQQETLLTNPGDDVECKALARIVFGERDERSELSPGVQAWLQRTLPDLRDRKLFLLSIEEGRLTVSAFAALYEAQALSLDEQRREMKRHRDRITKRVRRDSAALLRLITGSTDRKEKSPDGN